MDIKKLYEKVKEYAWEAEAKNYYWYVSWLIKDPKQKWASTKDENYFYLKYVQVKNEGLILDWKHITLQSTGISFDYVAYKNKMLLAYPDSKIDINLIYKWDDFNFSKKDWKVSYTHKIWDPFKQTDDKIVGGYCVIKNKRWEFLTLLSKEDFEKHRKVAKTDFIWKAWYKEMCLKTLFKKAIKVHFDDIYEDIEKEDNEQYDLEKFKEQIEKEQELKQKEKSEELKTKYKDL